MALRLAKLTKDIIRPTLIRVNSPHERLHGNFALHNLIEHTIFS